MAETRLAASLQLAQAFRTARKAFLFYSRQSLIGSRLPRFAEAGRREPETGMKALRNLRLVAVALAAVLLVGTAGFHFIEGWPWFDGFYMVVTTLTTIGYQEVHPLSHSGRVFNVFIIVAGVSVVFLAIGAVLHALVEFAVRCFVGWV